MKKNRIYDIFLGLVPFIIVEIDLLILLITCNISFKLYPSLIVPSQSIAIIYCFFLLFVFITKSYRKANIILTISSFILMTINQIKFFYMHEPIYLSDIKLLGGANDIIQLTNGTIIEFFTNNYLIIISHIIIITLFLIILIKNKQERVNRNILLLVPFIILIILSLPFKSTTSFMKKNFLHTNSFNDYSSLTHKYDYNILYGFSGGIYANMLDERIFEPDNYSLQKIEKVFAYESQDKKEDNDYNIIFILSESFFDITRLDEIQFNNDILKDYHDLTKQGKLIQMISPTYGGRTSNVEFDLLTSFNLAYYDSSYIPFLHLFNTPFPRESNIINIFNDNMYNNYLLPGGGEELYSANKVYNNLGFKNRVYLDDDKSNYKGYYLSDKYITDKIINLLDTKKEKLFAFIETMQNHMPYTFEKYDKYNISILNSNLNREDQNVLLSYAEGLHDSSIELKRLYDYIKTIDKKTIIIFIGDHLPYLSNNKGEDIINKLDYFNTENALLNTYRKYNTDALILSNFEIKYDETKYLSPDLLIPYVLKSNNTKMNPYFSYLIEKSKAILPSYNKYVAIDNDGIIYDTRNLSDDMLKEYNLRNYLQYKIAFDK